MAGGLTYLQQFYGPLLQYDGLKLMKKNSEHGLIRDKDLVLIPIAPPEGKKEPKDSTFEVEVGSNYKCEFRKLTSRLEGAFFMAQYHFDQMMKSSRLAETIEADMKVLYDAETEEANLQVKELNDGGLSPDDESAQKRVRKKINEAKNDIEENVENLFRYYISFIQVRETKFQILMSTHCHGIVEHDREIVQVYKEAFRRNADGSKGGRYPEKDAEEHEDHTNGTGWIFVYKWKRATITVTQPHGKSLERFRLCRKEHVHMEFPEYGYAEAQWRYCWENITIPSGVEVKSFNEQIEQVSRLMYLLPSIHDDPDPSLAGQLRHLVRRDQPFGEVEMCQMLLFAMPIAVQEKWREENPKKRIPTDRPTLVKELQILLTQFRKNFKKNLDEKQQGKGGNNQRQNGGGSNGNSNGGGGSNRSGRKMCTRCDKKGEKDVVKYSHHAKDCEKYHPDLNAKVPSREKQLHAMEQERQAPSSDRKRKKSKKSRKDSKKSRKKKKKKSRRDSSSSDDSSRSSSSSDSDSS